MPAPTPTQKSIGDQLRSARELKEWSLAEVAKRTKVKLEQLDRLEKNQFDLLPSLAYARGFIRIYARELGLDGWALLRQFNGEVESGYDVLELQPHDLEAIPRRQQPAAATPQNVGQMVIIGVVLCALVIGGIQLYLSFPEWMAAARKAPETQLQPIEPSQPPVNKDTASVPSADQTASTPPVAERVATPNPPAAVPVAPPVSASAPVVVAPAPPAATPVAEPVDDTAHEAATGTNRLQLQADAASSENERWVRVVAIRGGREITLYEDLLPPGQVVPGDTVGPWVADEFVVSFREASAVDIIFNGNNYGRYDKPGIQHITLPGR
ncbi:MAG: helix-turn-helix domain-containing protein [Candidatus Methylacidiphilales bacterium]|nr:helix-turn-helix domain-containing protein [Candidatus Methylacidiphilales bacterium]